MIGRVLLQVRQSINCFEKHILFLLGRRYPPDSYCCAAIENCEDTNRNLIPSFSIDTFLKDPILWGVPKHRRPLEKRLNRKFGWPDKVWKLIVPKKNLLMCKACGDHYEAGHLCRTCYSKVKKETEEMQKEIETQLGLDPNDKEVMVLYQGEKEGKPDEFFEGKRIIEMKKERPQWYSKNLLEKTTQAPATTTSVKPTDLA